MVAFPDTIPPQMPYPTRPFSFMTYVSGPYRDRSVRSIGLHIPLYSASPTFPKRSWEEYEELFNFYVGRFGSALSFTWFDFHGYLVGGVPWPSIPFGVGDAVTTTWDLPFKAGVTDEEITDAAVVVSSSDYTIDGSGTDGRARIVFDTAPAEGDILAAKGTGRRAATVCFDQDFYDLQAFSISIQITGLPLHEVR